MTGNPYVLTNVRPADLLICDPTMVSRIRSGDRSPSYRTMLLLRSLLGWQAETQLALLAVSRHTYSAALRARIEAAEREITLSAVHSDDAMHAEALTTLTSISTACDSTGLRLRDLPHRDPAIDAADPDLLAARDCLAGATDALRRLTDRLHAAQPPRSRPAAISR